ncbi:transporter substrate-binding domain-containing protein [Lacimicrobium sp. SS2-24]|uniref:substrate-binding periplasmic protein n=1 Tax=Lacimicrobium sp. SS2-24 TaxID=2005569 RepID=UPI000B4AEF3F|nr:transporter substrate-binding domain-containing protein [Lacimicrobium sp. SS2-24]
MSMSNCFKIIFLGSFLFSLSLSAEDYVVGVEDLNYLPFAEVENGQYKGFFRDLLDKFGEDSAHNFSYKPMPIKRLMDQMISKKIDLKIPDSSFWASDAKEGKGVVYSQPITIYIDGIMVTPEKKGAGYDTIKSIATVRGFTPFPYMKAIEAGRISVAETSTLESVKKMVVMGRTDGGFVNVSVMNRLLKDVWNTPGAMVFDEELPDARSPISVSTAMHPELIKEFDTWLANNSSWVQQLREKYEVLTPE